MNRNNYYFNGQITAETQISVNRPNDNFKSLTGSDKLLRLPRQGPKKDGTPVFIPGDTFRGTLRRCGENFIRRQVIKLTNQSKPFSIDDLYMLRQGVDTRNKVLYEKTDGLMSSESSLRDINPFLSLFGRWKLAGHLGVGNLYPMSDDVIFINSKGVRTNDYIRSPEQIRFLKEEDVELVKKMILEDSNVSRGKVEINKQISQLMSDYENTSDANEKFNISNTINELKEKKDSLNDSKVGSKDSIQRPLDGHEAIKPGTIFSHRINLNLANNFELGLLFLCIREFSRSPFIGAQSRTSSGEISGFYDILCWEVDTDAPITLGRLNFSINGFSITEEIEGSLKPTMELFLSELNQSKFDFTKYLNI